MIDTAHSNGDANGDAKVAGPPYFGDRVDSNLGPILRPEARVVRADRSLAAMVLVICTLGGMGVGFGFAMYLMRAQLAYAPMSEAHFYSAPSRATLLGVWYAPSRDHRGALIDSVMRGTGAENAGLLPGDVVTTVDGEDVREGYALTSAIRSHDPGEVVPISVERNGRPLLIRARLGFR